MKKITLFLFLTLNVLAAQSQTAAEAWATLYPLIDKAVVAPTFADRDFNILDYGKRSDKEGHLYTDLINGTIKRCHQAGGGRVIIPAGEWLTGPITLLSDVNLHLEEGATLLFTTDESQYPLVYTRWEGMDCYNYQPLIYANGAENIALTGKGIVDGNGSNEHWWYMKAHKEHGYKEGMISQKIGRPLLMEQVEKGVPAQKRRFGSGYGLRPQLVNFVHCKNVLIEDVTLLRSPFWVIHPLFCENLTVRGVHVENDGPNGDGCDPESCRNVVIENCFFDTGDDCIAIKSGRNRDGRVAGIPSENIIVRNCRMKNGHGGVVVGSEISGGYRNLFVHDCIMDSPNLDRVVRIKTNSCRGGVIENIYVRDVEVGQCAEAVLKINLVYEPNEACTRGFNPTVRNVFLERVTCNKSKYGVFIETFDDDIYVYNIKLIDCTFNNVGADPILIKGKTAGIGLTDVTINGVTVPSPRVF